MDEYYSAIQRLPAFLPACACGSATPARLYRAGSAASQRAAGHPFHRIRARAGPPCRQGRGQQAVLTHPQLQECFFSLCDHSVHSYEQQIAQGFLPAGGHRVGVAGVLHLERAN